MKLLLLETFGAMLAVALATTTSCSIEHATDDLACTVQADCDATRTCVGGYCVVTTTMTGCPAGCTSCDMTARTCTISTTGNGKVKCPSGWSCAISCANNACSEVDCEDATACTITCSGNRSCESVRCGAGRCQVTCSGMDSCGDVDCRDSCACDVSCTGASSCGNERCPAACTGSSGCTSQGPGCNSC